MSEDVTIKMLEAYIKTFERWNDLYPITPQLIETLKSTLEIIEKQQEEIEYLKECNRLKNSLNGAKMSKSLINIGRKVGITEITIGESMIIEAIDNNFVSKDKIKEKIKELEEQQEKLKYDGNRSYADYEQFCKNLKFLKEQIEEILEEK